MTRSDTSDPRGKTRWIVAAIAYLFGMSVVTAGLTTLHSIWALRSFSADGRVCGIALVSLLRAQAPHIAAVSASIAAIVWNHDAAARRDDEPWRSWAPFAAGPKRALA